MTARRKNKRGLKGIESNKEISKCLNVETTNKESFLSVSTRISLLTIHLWSLNCTSVVHCSDIGRGPFFPIDVPLYPLGLPMECLKPL
jgi:hypothetical protein